MPKHRALMVLLFFAALAAQQRPAAAYFPNGRCATNSCGALPVALTGPVLVDGGFCLDVVAQP